MDSARYPVPEIKDLPADICPRVLELQEKAVFVPNVFLAFSRRPAEWRAFFAYHDALMLNGDSGLSKGEREMMVTATSAANHCRYCVVAHGAILRIYEKKPLVADQVAVNYRKADITARQRAMLDFAMKVCLGIGSSIGVGRVYRPLADRARTWRVGGWGAVCRPGGTIALANVLARRRGVGDDARRAVGRCRWATIRMGPRHASGRGTSDK